jgi:phosphate transport system substrate-binding protein
VELQRYGRLLGVALVGALALTACGTDENSGSDSASDSSSGGSIQCAKGNLLASGSSAQNNAMTEWIKKYQSACTGASINYQSVGSGAGVEQFLQGSTDFAGSDSALKDTEQPKADARCKTGKAINLPMVTGPVAVAYNLKGVDGLILDAPTVAGIFSNKITKWDAPEIKKLNPSASLPSTPIQAFHRSDSSGTTDNFTKYLTAAAGSAWTFDKGKEWKAPGGQGAKGNEGVSASVKQTDGAVGYMEFSFAQNSQLPIAKISTGAAQPVELTTDSASKAVEAAKVVGTGNDLKMEIDYATKAEGAYPIVLVTYEIVCEKGPAADKVELLKSFLSYTASDDGQKSLADLGYAPLPSSIAEKTRTAVQTLA